MLTYILSCSGKVISRKELLDNIWDVQGLQPSGSSLTQYISLIRRTLTELGAEEDIIITLPRAGFLVSADHIEYMSSPAEKSTEDCLPQEDGLHPLYYGALPLIIIVFIAFLSLSDIDFSMNVPEVSFGESMSTGSCMVHYLPRILQNKQHEFFADRLKNVGSCDKDTEFLVSADTKALNSGHGRIFLAKCKADTSYGGILHGCISYYEYQN